MFKKYGKHERSCLSCPSNCTLVVEIPGTTVGHAPEYETIGAFGSMCECDQIEVIALCNELCHDYGLDTISAGNTIAFVMEAFEKGLLSEAVLDGIRPTWGNAEAMVDLLHKIGKREGIGDLLADGTRAAAKRLDKDLSDMLVEVKGVEVPMYDPRSYGPTILAEWLNYCTGWKTTPEELIRTGERIFTAKRVINVARGLTRKDDYLPKRLFTVPQRDDIGSVKPKGMERLLTEYYRLRGWDANGAPTKARLKALGLT